MTIFLAKEFGIDLSSRRSAGRLRRLIDSSGDAVTVDLDGVRTISGSFADEAFAVLLKVRGEAWFSKTIRFVNASPEVRFSILEALQNRIVTPA
jgi:hypothetical protein